MCVMATHIIHLSDLHTTGNTTFRQTQLPSLIRCIQSHAAHGDTLLVFFTGDAANKGNLREFDEAHAIIHSLVSDIRSTHPDINLFIIPGNHDLNLSGDQAARDILLQNLNGRVPSASILAGVLPPLHEYWTFQQNLSPTGATLTEASPFFAKNVVRCGNHDVLVMLINSAWMCRRKDNPGTLHFPVELISPGDTSPYSYVMAAIHHPFNWLSQPESMRPVRDNLHSTCDLILTGHEHVPENVVHHSASVVTHSLGGVLADVNDATISSFHIATLDFDSGTQTLTTYAWRADVYAVLHHTQPVTLVRNINRQSDRLALDQKYSEWLEDVELPLQANATANNKQGNGSMRLADLFIFPDIRQYDPRHPTGEFKRISSGSVQESLAQESRTLITGFESSGKTSLAKRMFATLRNSGLVPVMLTKDDISRRVTQATLKQSLNKAIRRQYRSLTAEEFWQLPSDLRVLIHDDVHLMLPQLTEKEAFDGFLGQFSKVLLLGDSEISIAELRSADRDALLFEFHRFHICEFGHTLLRDLTGRWIKATRQDLTKGEFDGEVLRICRVVEHVLSMDAIPHQPWILLVLIQEADNNDEVAAKNGSYGHLFESIVTAALSRSSFHSLDIRSKYTYLAELAYFMFSRRLTTLDEGQVIEFHRAHCAKYDIDIEYDATIEDLGAVGIVRRVAGEVYFKTKYSYCFFVAWFLSQNLPFPGTKDILKQIITELHYSDIANIVVFLAHLTSDPIVLELVSSVAGSTFKDIPVAMLEDDLGPIATFGQADFVKLVELSPEESQRLVAEAKDTELHKRDARVTDGRAIQLSESHEVDSADNEFRKVVSELRKAMKSIQILGQILRNGAGAIPGNSKQRIVEDIFATARRLMGFILIRLPHDIPGWALNLANRYRHEMPLQQDLSVSELNEAVAEKVARHIFNTAWYATYSIVLHVANACGLEMLDNTFRRVVDADQSKPNRLFQMAIRLDRPGKLPKEEAVSLFNELADTHFCQSLVKALVIRHLQLYHVPHDQKASVMKRMDIPLLKGVSAIDPSKKRLGSN